MTLASPFREFVQQVSFVMTAPPFAILVTLLTGCVFARRQTVAGLILAADAVGTKYHLSFASSPGPNGASTNSDWRALA